MTLTVAVVKALTAEVRKRDDEAAAWVHWGATSQDVLDTAMVLQLRDALPPLIESLHLIVAAFATLAKEHRATPMMGRTLMQPATPLAFGQKVAGWASDIERARAAAGRELTPRRRSCSSAARRARSPRWAGRPSR